MAASGRGRCAGGRPGLSGRVGSGRRARRSWAGDVGVATAGRARGRRAGGRDGQGPWPGPGGGGGSDWLFVSARSKMAAAGAEGRAGRAGEGSGDAVLPGPQRPSWSRRRRRLRGPGAREGAGWGRGPRQGGGLGVGAIAARRARDPELGAPGGASAGLPLGRAPWSARDPVSRAVRAAARAAGAGRGGGRRPGPRQGDSSSPAARPPDTSVCKLLGETAAPAGTSSSRRERPSWRSSSGPYFPFCRFDEVSYLNLTSTFSVETVHVKFSPACFRGFFTERWYSGTCLGVLFSPLFLGGGWAGDPERCLQPRSS